MLQGLAGLNAWGKAGAVPVFPAVDRLFDEARTQGQNRKSPSRECGPVAQLGARFHGMEEVIGSIPIRSTKHFKHLAHSFQVACPPTAKTCSTAVSLSSQSRLPEPSSAPLVVGLFTLEEAVSASLFGPAAILTPASESILRSRSFGAGSYQLVLDCVERLPHLGLERLHGTLLRSCRRPLGALVPFSRRCRAEHRNRNSLHDHPMRGFHWDLQLVAAAYEAGGRLLASGSWSTATCRSSPESSLFDADTCCTNIRPGS